MTKNQIGRACLFFDCRAGMRKIKHELPYIRWLQNVPPQVELHLTTPSKLMRKKEMKTIAEKAKAEGIRYALMVMFPGRDSEDAVEEARAIGNQIYQSPLFEERGIFRGALAAKNENRWMSI